jgi:hypothetical protein
MGSYIYLYSYLKIEIKRCPVLAFVLIIVGLYCLVAIIIMFINYCRGSKEIQNFEYNNDFKQICNRNDHQDFDFRRDDEIIKTFTLDIFNKKN